MLDQVLGWLYMNWFSMDDCHHVCMARNKIPGFLWKPTHSALFICSQKKMEMDPFSLL